MFEKWAVPQKKTLENLAFFTTDIVWKYKDIETSDMITIYIFNIHIY